MNPTESCRDATESLLTRYEFYQIDTASQIIDAHNEIISTEGHRENADCFRIYAVSQIIDGEGCITEPDGNIIDSEGNIIAPAGCRNDAHCFIIDAVSIIIDAEGEIIGAD